MPTHEPPLRTLPKRIEAPCYNRVRLALGRLGRPLRVPLPRHRGLEVVLDDAAWRCVDATAGDMPVLAWCGFEARGRDNLHEPVACRLELYHRQAGLIMGSALEDLDATLRELLAPPPAAQGGDDAAG